MSLTEIALVTGFLLSFLMAIALGGNDAATPTETAVGARVLTIRQAVVLFALFVALGALTQGFMVMKTVGTGIVPSIDLLGAIVAVLSAFIWIMFCNFYGLEISVTHSIIGSILGYGIAAYGIGGIQWGLIQTVIISWLTSPLLAAFIAFLLYKLIAAITAKYAAVTRSLPTLLKLALCYSAYAFGANDIANATGVYVTVTKMILGFPPEYNIMLLLAAFGSLGIALGGFLLGPRVIETVAFKITRLNPVTGASAEVANALVVHLFTIVPYMILGYGMPISTSLASVGALIGVGLASYGSSGINRRTVTVLSLSWVATVFVTAFIAYVAYSILFPFTGSIIKPAP
ncbi:MAG: inorganic phosphate transporter [Candidatus Bathyarchaeia archaeon]